MQAEIDPRQAPLLAPCETSARRNPTVYVMVVAGAVFVAASLAISPARHCVETACPTWLRATAFGFGAVFALGGLLALLRDTRAGSRIDWPAGALVWWVGVPPFREVRVPLDRIATVVWDTSGDSNSLLLLDARGKRLFVPEDCLRAPLDAWARALVAACPHVRFEHRA